MEIILESFPLIKPKGIAAVKHYCGYPNKAMIMKLCQSGHQNPNCQDL
jgi:hypothetical protein